MCFANQEKALHGFFGDHSSTLRPIPHCATVKANIHLHLLELRGGRLKGSGWGLHGLHLKGWPGNQAFVSVLKKNLLGNPLNFQNMCS